MTKTKPYSLFYFLKGGLRNMGKDTIINGTIYAFLAVYVIALVFIPLADRSSEWYIVTSSSMEPTFKVGDMVYVSEVDPNNIQEGDIITFKIEEDGATITHRCIEVVKDRNELYFRTKGDANEEQDRFIVHDDEVIGKINNNKILGQTFYNKIPRLGYLSQFAHTFLGFITLIIVPGMALISMETYNIVVTIFENDSSRDKNGKDKFNDIFGELKSKLKSVRKTDIEIQKIITLVKEANRYSEEGKYTDGISKCKEAIRIIDDYKELNKDIKEIERHFNELKEGDDEYNKTNYLLNLSREKSNIGDYKSALNIIKLSREFPILNKKM